MRTSIVRSVQSAIARSSSSSTYVRARAYSSDSVPERKVAVLGAAGGIGQPLALLMKLNPLVSKLSLYDIAGTPGVAADVSHINTRSEVSLSFSFISTVLFSTDLGFFQTSFSPKLDLTLHLCSWDSLSLSLTHTHIFKSITWFFIYDKKWFLFLIFGSLKEEKVKENNDPRHTKWKQITCWFSHSHSQNTYIFFLLRIGNILLWIV